MIPGADAWDAHRVAKRVVAELANSGFASGRTLAEGGNGGRLRPKRRPLFLLRRQYRTQGS
jgi:hypothetical protein